MSAWLPTDRPWLMGIVNVTPDSFSDGGLYLGATAAIAHGAQLWRDGADVLDIGGEATNPRATAVDATTESARVVPVIHALRAQTSAILSVDTTKAAVAAAAIAAGATIVNDIAGGRFDAAIWGVAASSPQVTYVCGHLRGASLAEVFAAEQPVTVDEVIADLAARLALMPATLRGRTVVDPGLGFGKGADASNWALLRASGRIAAALGTPILIGASRKRFVRRMLDARGVRITQATLDDASADASLEAIGAGAHGVRVHDVAGMRRALMRPLP